MTKRALIDPFVVGPPRAVNARTRLFVSLTDEQVLTQVGEHLGSLLRSDLATRCRLAAGPKYPGARQAQTCVGSTLFFPLGGRHYPGNRRHVGARTTQPGRLEVSGS